MATAGFARLALMRVATWNVNSLNARMPRLLEWLAYAQPDVLAVQETKLADDKFPAAEFAELGYQSAHHGGGRWNGVAVLSKVGIEDVVCGFADGAEDDPEARLISATCGELRISSVYVPNGRAVDHDHYRYKLAWLARLHAHLTESSSPSDRVLVAGDFNVCPDDRDVWDPQNPEPRTHVTAPERTALAALTDWGLVDLFRERYSSDGLFSWWDYRQGAFYKKQGLRIDLLLATKPVADALTFCLMDRNARKGAKPSDHVPVFADLNL